MDFEELVIIQTNGVSTIIENKSGKDRLKLSHFDHDYIIKNDNGDILFAFPMHSVITIYDKAMYNKYNISVDN